MPVLIKFNFPAGRYHATPWGRHVNEGVAEWPPSPWRLLRALIAVWKRTCPDIDEPSMRRVLEALSEPPRFKLPPHRVAHTRHYMPWEKKGPLDRTLIFDTFVSVNRSSSLYAGWNDVHLSHDDRATLSRLLDNLSSLGRAESWISAELADGEVELDIAPASHDANDPVRVLCADPASAFGDEYYPTHDPKKLANGQVKPADYLFDCPRWHLCLDTETIHAKRWSSAPGARWVNYTRPTEKAALRPSQSRTVETRPTVARFLLDGPVLPLLSDCLPVAEAVRRTAMGCFRRWCERHPERAISFRRTDDPAMVASPILSGKDASGMRLPGSGHAHYWPIATEYSPRRICGMMLFARDGFGPAEVAALSGMKSLKFGQLQELRLQLVGLGQSQQLGQELLGPARVWQSLTPFLGHGQIGIRGRSRFLRKGLRREWRRLAEQVPDLEGVELQGIDELTPEENAQRGLPNPNAFCRSRSKHGGREAFRPAAMFRLTFSRPIDGPISLGYANHFGFGLMAAAK